MRVRATLAAVLVGGAALSTGCTWYPRIRWEPRAAGALGEQRGGYAAVRVFFATTRRDTREEDPRLRFGAERSAVLSYGTGQVSIPARHCRGQLERGLFDSQDPQRSVALLGLEVLDAPRRRQPCPTRFCAALREQLDRSPRREVLVFVHGYAISFEEAILRAGQIAHDLRFDGVPIAYCWPTQGLYLSYLIDGTNAEWTVPFFVDFLEALESESRGARIHLFAHSMGTRVLARGIRDFMARRGRPVGGVALPTQPALDPPLGQVIFAAADMDAEIFERDYAPAILQAARRTTIYISSNDWVLGLSLRLNGYFRLGQTDLPHLDLEAMRRIDVIDVGKFDQDLLGHFYYGSSPRVLEDLAAVLDTSASPLRLDELELPTGPEQEKLERRLQRTFYYRLQER